MSEVKQYCLKCGKDTNHNDVNGHKCQCLICGTFRPFINEV